LGLPYSKPRQKRVVFSNTWPTSYYHTRKYSREPALLTKHLASLKPIPPAGIHAWDLTVIQQKEALTAVMGPNSAGGRQDFLMCPALKTACLDKAGH